MVVFFFPVDRDLILRLAAEGGCGKIVADDGGTVFDPVPFTALEPSARPTSPRRRVESSVRSSLFRLIVSSTRKVRVVFDAR